MPTLSYSSKKWLLACFYCFFFISLSSFAQELNCTVTIDSKQLVTDQATERSLFTDLQKAISNFINNTKWTSDEFQPEERINCNLLITLTNSPTQNVFEATAQIKATRPIFNTNYESNLLVFIDRSFNFQYLPAQPLIFNINSFTNNLTSILAFYAYSILAMDYDSFAKEGGADYAEKAFNIANIAFAQANPDAGWKRDQDTRNRYWLAENMFSQQMIPFRVALYDYHRLGLDAFQIDAPKSREKIAEVLRTISQVNKVKPSAIFTNIFFDAKNDEIVNIFKNAPLDLKREIRNILVQIDPGRTAKYNVLTN